MAETAVFEPGGYRYVRGQFKYSGGVAAQPGYVIERARFARPVLLEEGFRRIEAHLAALGRPPTAFCACELRSPGQFTDEGFDAFNRLYVGTLERWGIFKDEENPVARSNVCPEVHPPTAPCFHAFSYTLPAEGAGATGAKSFVISGSGEAPEGGLGYADRIIRLGDTTPDAMREKAQFVLGALELRMTALGLSWEDATTSQVYTVHDIHHFLADEVVRRGAAPDGVTWTYARPPVEGLAFEMDVRSVPVERIIG